MWKIIVGILVLITLATGVGLYVFYYKPLVNNSPTPSPQQTSTLGETREDRAAFGVYINNQVKPFTSPEFLNRSKDAFISKEEPNIVHIYNSEMTWGAFFKTLPVSLSNECFITEKGENFCNGNNGSLQFFVNGIKVDSILNKKMSDGDRLLITFGKENADQISQQNQDIANPLP